MAEFLPQIIMIVALFALLYFMLIRPQKKKDDEVRKMREALKVGDDILTIGGIYGRIVRIKEDRLIIQIGTDKTKMEIAKWAVNNIERKEDSRAKDAAEDKKVTPKNIKKLGEKTESEPEEAPQDAE